MTSYTRRDFLVYASAGVAASLAPSLLPASTASETFVTQLAPSAFVAIHELKPLPFDPAKLDGLSERLIRSHWENNYGDSVREPGAGVRCGSC